MLTAACQFMEGKILKEDMIISKHMSTISVP